ncbi:putative leader peptide [Streptomyces sp. ACT015]|jgi:hypothetical protein|nr:hypothetical protein GA0115242_127210 [Streptomyces sp. SolWspMP-5a-2]
MRRLEPAVDGVSRTPRPSLLTSRLHIDLLRVCSAIDPLA